MEINRKDDTKVIEVWLTKAERDDPELRESLKPYYKKWKAAGYLPVVFLSGNEDLYENTLELLKRNRNRSARKAVEAERLAQKQQDRQIPDAPVSGPGSRPSVRKKLAQLREMEKSVNSSLRPAPEQERDLER